MSSLSPLELLFRGDNYPAIGGTLGLGVLQINSGLDSLFGIPNSITTQIILIACITGFASLSLMLGVDKGIKRLSDINILFTFVLLTFVIILGPTQFIFNSLIENTGNYLHQAIPLGMWTESYEGEETGSLHGRYFIGHGGLAGHHL